MSETKHTPLPWKWDGDNLWHFGVDYSDKEDPHVYTGITIDERLRKSPLLKVNKELILESVNSAPIQAARSAELEGQKRVISTALDYASREVRDLTAQVERLCGPITGMLTSFDEACEVDSNHDKSGYGLSISELQAIRRLRSALAETGKDGK